MRKVFLLGTLVGVGLPVLAAAQPPPPPPPGGPAYSTAPIEPKMRFDIGLFAAIPQGDLEDANAGTSPGLNLQFGYNFMPNIGLSVGLRGIAIQTEDGDETDLSNYDFDIGLRYTAPVSPTVKVFGEALLIYSTLAFDNGDVEESESGIGFGLRGGGQFRLSGNIWLGGALSYTTANIDFGDGAGDIDVPWFGVEGFVSFGF